MFYKNPEETLYCIGARCQQCCSGEELGFCRYFEDQWNFQMDFMLNMKKRRQG